jgi:N4-gp56 family major capsid protein
MPAFTPLNSSTDAGGGSVGDLRDEQKTFYKKGLLKFAEKRTVLNQFGQNATLPRNQGKIYEWRNVSQMTLVTGAQTVLTEGVTPSGSFLTFTKLTATVAQYGDYYAGTDVLDATIYDPIRTIVVDAQAYQMAQVIDNLIQIAAVTGATNRFYSNAATGATTRATLTQADILNETEIRKVVRTMRRNSAKPLRDGNFVAVIHPDTTYTLFQDPDIREAMVNSKLMKNGDRAGSLFTGEIGEYMGVTFIETELAKVVLKTVHEPGGTNPDVTPNATVDVYQTIFFAADYFGKIKLTDLNTDSIFHDVGSSGGADALNQRWTQGWKMTFGSRILFPLYAVVLEHANAL